MRGSGPAALGGLAREHALASMNRNNLCSPTEDRVASAETCVCAANSPQQKGAKRSTKPNVEAAGMVDAVMCLDESG